MAVLFSAKRPYHAVHTQQKDIIKHRVQVVIDKKQGKLFNLKYLKVPGPIASDFFKLTEILVSEESSYFSHYP